MKAHDLKPAPGSRTPRTRVGRGIAAGKGKTAGRGTKGQLSRAGGNLPAWFEGGQTPIHIRVPKLRGFKSRTRVEYQVVNVGRIAEYARAGRFGNDPAQDEPVTVNAEVLRAAGLVASASRAVKVLGAGEVDVKLFVAADAFSATARSRIEAAGGFVQALAPEKAPAEAVAEEPAVGPAQPDRAADATPTGADAVETSASEGGARASASEGGVEADAPDATAAGRRGGRRKSAD